MKLTDKQTAQFSKAKKELSKLCDMLQKTEFKNEFYNVAAAFRMVCNAEFTVNWGKNDD